VVLRPASVRIDWLLRMSALINPLQLGDAGVLLTLAQVVCYSRYLIELVPEPGSVPGDYMKARDLLFIAIVLVAVGGLYYLSTRGRVRPMPPQPPAHLSAKTRGECLACHTPQTMASLEQAHKHPGKWKDEKVSCLKCHTAPQAAASAMILNPAIKLQTIGSLKSEELLWLKQKQS